MMKVDSKVFTTFLNKASVNGELIEMFLEFTPEGMLSSLKGETTAFVKGLLKKDTFINYEEGEGWGISNSGRFIKLVERLKGIISLHKEANKLFISDESKDLVYVLCSKDYVNNYCSEEPGAQFDGGVEMESAKLAEVQKDCDLLKTNFVNVEVKEKVLKIIVKEDGGDTITENISLDYKDAKSKYGPYLLSVSKILDGKINLSFTTDGPIQIKEASEKMHLRFLIAPCVENNPAGEKKEEKKEEVKKE